MLWASGICTIQTTADDSIWARRTICVMIDGTSILLLLQSSFYFRKLALLCVFMDKAATALCINTHVHLQMSLLCMVCV